MIRVDTNTVKISSHTRRLAALLIAAALLVVAAIAPTHAFAQSDSEQETAVAAEGVIFDDLAGPYRVRISQVPARAIVGTLRIIVEPTDATTGLPVENALIRIFGTPPETGDRQFSPGLNAPSDRKLYFGQLQLEEAGVWTLDVEIDADQGRAIAIGQTTIHERARSGSGTLIGTILFTLISLAFVGVGVWLWYTSRKARQRRNAIRKTGGRPRRNSG